MSPGDTTDLARSKTTRAIALYQRGFNFREIGERLGVSASTARRWLIKAHTVQTADGPKVLAPVGCWVVRDPQEELDRYARKAQEEVLRYCEEADYGKPHTPKRQPLTEGFPIAPEPPTPASMSGARCVHEYSDGRPCNVCNPKSTFFTRLLRAAGFKA